MAIKLVRTDHAQECSVILIDNLRMAQCTVNCRPEVQHGIRKDYRYCCDGRENQPPHCRP
jgi:hypothetical protein